MRYTIEVDSQLNDILIANADLRHIGVPALISELLKRYVIDAHIMEQSEIWQSGIRECADINLDWASL